MNKTIKDRPTDSPTSRQTNPLARIRKGKNPPLKPSSDVCTGGLTDDQRIKETAYRVTPQWQGNQSSIVTKSLSTRTNSLSQPHSQCLQVTGHRSQVISHRSQVIHRLIKGHWYVIPTHQMYKSLSHYISQHQPIRLLTGHYRPICSLVMIVQYVHRSLSSNMSLGHPKNSIPLTTPIGPAHRLVSPSENRPSLIAIPPTKHIGQSQNATIPHYSYMSNRPHDPSIHPSGSCRSSKQFPTLELKKNLSKTFKKNFQKKNFLYY